MKPFYSFKTADFTPTSYKSKYLSEYYNQARSMLRLHFDDEAIQNILAEENRIGNILQLQTSIAGDFKRISEFDDDAKTFLFDKFCLLRDQIIGHFESKSKLKVGGNAKEWMLIFEEIFNPTNIIIFSNGNDIAVVWGWSLLNNENYLPFLNYSKKEKSQNVIQDNSVADTNSQNEDLENNIYAGKGLEGDESGDEKTPGLEGNETIILNIDEDEKQLEKEIPLISEVPKPTLVKPIGSLFF